MDILFLLIMIFLATRVGFLTSNITHTALLPGYRLPTIIYMVTMVIYYTWQLFQFKDRLTRLLTIATGTMMIIGIFIPCLNEVPLTRSAHIFFMSAGGALVIIVVLRLIYLESFVSYDKALKAFLYLASVVSLLSAIFFFYGINGLFEVAGFLSFVLFLRFYRQ